MKITTVEVNKKQFTFAQVGAEEQLKLYEEVGARLLANCLNTLTEKIDLNLLKGLLLGSPKGTISHIAEITLVKCREVGKEDPVHISDFGGNIDSYVELVCHGLMVNLADFFTFIESRVTEQKELLEKLEKETL